MKINEPKELFELYDDEDEDGEVDEDRMDERCGKPRVNRISNPINPTKLEVLEHRAAVHVPYRSWRRHCVRGKAKNDLHRQTRRS